MSRFGVYSILGEKEKYAWEYGMFVLYEDRDDYFRRGGVMMKIVGIYMDSYN